MQAFQSTFRRHGGPELTSEEVRALFGPTEEGILQRTFGNGWRPAFDTYLAEYRRLHAGCPEPFPGIRELLADLGGLPLGLVTAKGSESARITLEVLALNGVFDPIETGSDHGFVKAEAIGRVLAAWGLPAGRVAYVGDVPADVVHARRAGVMAVAAAWSEHADAEALAAEKPDQYFDEVGHLAGWLLDTIDRE